MMEIPINLDDLGVPPFSETPIYMSEKRRTNIHIFLYDIYKLKTCVYIINKNTRIHGYMSGGQNL